MHDLTFHRLKAANFNRSRRWHPGGLGDWSRHQWLVATAGEFGEAANVIKKLNRDSGNLVGNRGAGRDELLVALGDELADTLIYLDQLAQRDELDLAACLQHTCGTAGPVDRLRIAELPASTGQELNQATTVALRGLGGLAWAVEAIDGALAAGEQRVEPQRAALATSMACFLRDLGQIAHTADVDLAEAVVRKFNAVSDRNGFLERL